MTNSNKMFSLLLSAAVLTVPVAAAAQGDAPVGAGPASLSDLKPVTAAGTIVREAAGQYQLASGQIIYVNSGTVIKPGNASLTGAARVYVTGYANGEDGSINATEIDINPPAQ